MFRLRMLAMLAIGAAVIFAAPVGHATQVAQGGQQTPPALPQNVINSITTATCDPTRLEAAVKQAVAANPDLAADIVSLAVGQCPGDAAGVAATAAAAAPTQAAAIVVAAITALPPGQQQNNAPEILVAVEQAVPEAADQITTAITALAFSPGPNPGTGGRTNIGAPLVAPQTDVSPPR